MTEPLTPAAGSRIMPCAQRFADILTGHVVRGEIDAARNRGDHETAEKWEAHLSQRGPNHWRIEA